MATSVWKGYLTFGLISIPIRLFSAARGERISLNQLHSVCHSRIKMPLFCPVCDRKVERSEIVKGYEYEKDQYVLFDEKELEKIEPESARSMEILEFVRLDEIDPLYYESSYYVTPEDEGRKAYQLLLDAMEKSGYAAIAKITMHQREHIVVIRPRDNGMTLHTMFYTNEIRAGSRVRQAYSRGRTERSGKETGHTAHREPGRQIRAGKIQRPVSREHEGNDRGEAGWAGSCRSAACQDGSGD